MQETIKERSIIFSGPMVRAILDGQKTMTRRVIKNEANRWHIDKLVCDWCLSEPPEFDGEMASFECQTDVDESRKFDTRCPYGKPGERIWVQETWRTIGDFPLSECTGPEGIQFAAGADEASLAIHFWRPSKDMPRWASRILLEIVSVRVERVQEISEPDALAEGCETLFCARCDESGESEGAPCEDCNGEGRRSPSQVFRTLWNSINAERGHSWESNPWVWVVEFRRIEPAQEACHA